MIFGRDALEMARETIQDLRRRLDDATADNRLLQQQLLQRPLDIPRDIAPQIDVMAEFTLPSVVMDEIELVSSSLAMTRHLEKWALSELRKGTEQSTVIEQIREGDTVSADREPDE